MRNSGTHWRQTLADRYHNFAGAYHGQPNAYDVTVERGRDGPELMLRMIPPYQNRDFFNASQYAKRLVGNAYSVATVEHILRPLRDIFACREYRNYIYDFPWSEQQQDGECTL